MTDQTDFTKKVIQFIKAIPKGKVATYGQIAALAGKPQGSRGVGWILHSSTRSHDLPWQRVIRSGGKLSFPEMSEPFILQKKKLAVEGVVVENGKVDLKIYQWQKTPVKKLERFVSKKK